MRRVVPAIVLACAACSTTRMRTPVMKSSRAPARSCVVPRPNIAAQVLAPVALFVVGAVVVGAGYLAIGGERP